MKIEELNSKHYDIEVIHTIKDLIRPEDHTEASIEFTIEILEEFKSGNSLGELPDIIENKIQELKKHIQQ